MILDYAVASKTQTLLKVSQCFYCLGRKLQHSIPKVLWKRRNYQLLVFAVHRNMTLHHNPVELFNARSQTRREYPRCHILAGSVFVVWRLQDDFYFPLTTKYRNYFHEKSVMACLLDGISRNWQKQRFHDHNTPVDIYDKVVTATLPLNWSMM